MSGGPGGIIGSNQRKKDPCHTQLRQTQNPNDTKRVFIVLVAAILIVFIFLSTPHNVTSTYPGFTAVGFYSLKIAVVTSRLMSLASLPNHNWPLEHFGYSCLFWHTSSVRK